MRFGLALEIGWRVPLERQFESPSQRYKVYPNSCCTCQFFQAQSGVRDLPPAFTYVFVGWKKVTIRPRIDKKSQPLPESSCCPHHCQELL